MTASVPSRAYAELNEMSLAAYIAETAELQAFFAGGDDRLEITEIGDGNLNLVFHVRRGRRALAIKQALPYARVSGGSRTLTRERIHFEKLALEQAARRTPEHVPAIHHFNDELSLLCLEFLEPHIIMRKGMMAGTVYPHFAEHMARFLAEGFFATSDLALKAAEKRLMAARFSRNTELCEITERLIFTEPYTDSPHNRWTSPALDEAVAAIRADTALKLAVSRLKLRFMTCSEALLHGDLHTGSIMLTETDTRVIDPEFAVFGPMGFDIGVLVGNLLLSFFAQYAYEREPDERHAYRQWILATIEALWDGFAARFAELWLKEQTGDAFPASLFDTRDARAGLEDECRLCLERVLADTMGFAGAEMIRRVTGRAQNIDLESIADPARKGHSEGLALELARHMVTAGGGIGSMKELTSLAHRVVRPR
ncbi:S-methyl-5-thioribose kinase [Geminicoccaceae bacterium 1502E]|nr:S-methyl-5-thioribose kinase [Geminicoccaceae bacterium 1502E]